MNALSNLAFIAAAFLIWRLATKQDVKATSVSLMIVLAATVGVGSFIFHTVPNHVTLWLDILPILIFQICFIWNFCQKVIRLGSWSTLFLLLLVIGLALILRPIRQPMNGSMFYFPPLLTLLIFGWIWGEKSEKEPWTLFIAGACFALAVIARSVDWEVDIRIGTHFLWHLLNGVVIYLSLRTVVLVNGNWQPLVRR